jgi:hypothetical protein
MSRCSTTMRLLTSSMLGGAAGSMVVRSACRSDASLGGSVACSVIVVAVSGGRSSVFTIRSSSEPRRPPSFEELLIAIPSA